MSDNIRTALYDAELHRARWPPRAPTAPPRAVAGWSASTARAATSWCATAGCRPTSRPATCSRSPRPAPTATSMASNYNQLPRPAVVAVRDGVARAIAAPRDTVRRVRPRRRPADCEPSVHRRQRRSVLVSDPLRSPCSAAAPSAAEVVRLLTEQADELAARVGGPARAGRGRRPPPAPAPGPARRPADHRRGRAGRPGRRRRRRRGDRRHRAGPHAAARRRSSAGKSVVTANKALLAEHGAALYEAADAVRRRPVLRGGRRRGDPAAAAAARVAGRRPDHPGHRASSTAPRTSSSRRWTTPAPSYARGAGGGHPAGLRRGRPDRGRRRLRRRGQGRDPRLARLPHPGDRADVYREGIADGLRRRHRRRGRRSAARSSCSRSASGSPANGTRPESVSARVHPAMIPAAHPLAAVDGAFNAVFVEAEAAGQLMFYGQGAGGAPTAQRGARRPGRGGAQPGGRRARAARVGATPTCRSSRWARCRPATTSASTSRTARACWRRSRTVRRHGVSISTVRQRRGIGGDGDARW